MTWFVWLMNFFCLYIMHNFHVDVMIWRDTYACCPIGFSDRQYKFCTYL